MFSEIWRSWVEMVLKSLKRWGEGRFLNPPTPPPKKKPSMEGKWTIPVIKYYISDTGQ